MLPTQRPEARVSAVLHGVDPMHGHPITYRITPLERQPGVPAGFMVEDDSTGRTLMTAGQVRDLVRRVTAEREAASVTADAARGPVARVPLPV